MLGKHNRIWAGNSNLDKPTYPNKEEYIDENN